MPLGANRSCATDGRYSMCSSSIRQFPFGVSPMILFTDNSALIVSKPPTPPPLVWCPSIIFGRKKKGIYGSYIVQSSTLRLGTR